ncbi:MAG TPA: hypothetical protein P5059_02825 [Candidatus Dojkabacteria bacterium]|nr:hypothetical protein [Candidatus Dojkabacteria bacterium]
MTELEQVPVNYVQLINDFEVIYPQLHLTAPLSEADFTTLYPGMNSYEFKFASFLYSNGYTIFREPNIQNCVHVPDFFVYSPFDDSGKLVELTMYNREFTNCNISKRPQNEVKKTLQRKKVQLEEIKECGIPYIILYRKELEYIRKEYIKDLF